MPDRNITLRNSHWTVQFLHINGEPGYCFDGQTLKGRRIKAMTAVTLAAQSSERLSARYALRRERKVTSSEFKDRKIEIVGDSNHDNTKEVIIYVYPEDKSNG